MFTSADMIAVLHFTPQRCDCAVRSALFLWKDVSTVKPGGESITFASCHGLHGADIESKKHSGITHIMPHSHYPNVSLCLCRASIVQKKVIYFQDEGSLTIRLCEKGNSSCPSSPHAFILDRSSWRHYPLFYLSFLLFKAEQLSVLSYCKLKKKPNRGSGGNPWGHNGPQISRESVWNLNVPFEFWPQSSATAFYVTCLLRRKVPRQIWKDVHLPN